MNNDISFNFGADLIVSQNGDLLLAGKSDLLKQRIIERMLTNPGTYIWHPNYGAGLPRYIGQTLSLAKLQEIEALIIEQIYLEDAVSKSNIPNITFEQLPNGLSCQITYYESGREDLQTLSFTVTQ